MQQQIVQIADAPTLQKSILHVATWSQGRFSCITWCQSHAHLDATAAPVHTLFSSTLANCVTQHLDNPIQTKVLGTCVSC